MRRKGNETNLQINNDYKFNFNSLSKIEKKIKASTIIAAAVAATVETTTSTTIATTISTTTTVIKTQDIQKSNPLLQKFKSLEINDSSLSGKKAKNALKILERVPTTTKTTTTVAKESGQKQLPKPQSLKQPSPRKVSGKSAVDSLLETTC